MKNEVFNGHFCFDYMKTFLKEITLCFFTAVLLAPCRLGAQVFINEIQSSNDTTLSDAHGTSSDWIELYNAGTSAVDLSGWGLSDKANKPFKWTFPEGVFVPAKGHLLVWANGKEPTTFSAREPNTVEGLRLWLRGDDALSAYGNGGKVTKWADASGFGNHATNATYRPTVVSRAVNGHAAVKFVHSSQQMLCLPTTKFQGMSSLSNSTVFIVNQWSGTSTSVGLFGQWKSSDSSANCHFEVKSGGVLRLRLADVDFETVSGVIKQGQWATVASVSDMSRESRYVSIFQGRAPGFLTGGDSWNDLVLACGSLLRRQFLRHSDGQFSTRIRWRDRRSPFVQPGADGG